MNTRTKSTLSSPWAYFFATFAWTWLIWGMAVVLRASMETNLGRVILLLGVMGPMVTGIGFTYLTRDKAGRRSYWMRVVNVRQIPTRWYLVILLFAPVLNTLAALADVLTGGSGATWGEAARNFLPNPLSVIPSILFASLIPFIEELGWCGYALDRLLDRRSALVASVTLGVMWSLWHLPLFFIEGSYQASLGVGTPAFWLFMIGIVPLSVVIAWVCNNTGRSTLAAILFHAMVNFSGEVIALSERADTLTIGLWCIAAAAIAVSWMPQMVTRRRAAMRVLGQGSGSMAKEKL